MNTQVKTIITSVVGAIIIGSVFFAANGITDNTKDIAVNKNSITNMHADIKDVKKSVKEVIGILLKRKGK